MTENKRVTQITPRGFLDYETAVHIETIEDENKRLKKLVYRLKHVSVHLAFVVVAVVILAVYEGIIK